jgi:hypothetical protein
MASTLRPMSMVHYHDRMNTSNTPPSPSSIISKSVSLFSGMEDSLVPNIFMCIIISRMLCFCRVSRHTRFSHCFWHSSTHVPFHKHHACSVVRLTIILQKWGNARTPRKSELVRTQGRIKLKQEIMRQSEKKHHSENF